MRIYDKDHIPRVSIGMPVYNGANFIREAIDSLLLQTFTDFELIISDNASIDETEAICREYAKKDLRIRYIRQPENRGIIFNFKLVLEEAKGEYFMWAAHDDIVSSKDYLAILLNVIKDRYDFVFPNVKIIETKNGKNRTLASNFMEIFSKCSDRYSYCMKSIEINSYQIYGLFQKSSLLEQVKYIYKYENWKCYNDGIFVHAISANLSGCYVPNAIKIYRSHLTNLSRILPPHDLLIGFIKFSFASINFWITESKLSFFQKISILLKIVHIHGRYSVFLFAVTCKQFLRFVFSADLFNWRNR